MAWMWIWMIGTVQRHRVPGVLLAFAACAGPGPSTADRAASCAAAPAATAPVLFREEFPDTCFAERGWYDHTGVAVATDQHAPGSSSAAEFHFASGATTPESGGAIRHTFPPSSSLYISYWVKYSDSWVGSGKTYHPHEFMVMSSRDGEWDGPSVSWLTLYVEQNYDGGGRPRLALQDSRSINSLLGALPLSLIGQTEDRSVGGCNGVVETNVVTECYNAPPWTNDKQVRGPVTFQPAPGPGYKGNWNFVEAYFQLNTIADGVARPDGVMQYWFNDSLVIDRHDIQFRTATRADLQLRQFLIAPYIGDGSPVDQTMWVDDLTVATARVPRP